MLVPRQGQQGLFQLRVAPKTLRARHQPEVELVFHVAQLALQFRRIALGIVHQVAGVDLEESRQDLPGRVGQVRPRAALDLGEIALAQFRACLPRDGPHQFELAHGPVEAPKAALHFAQVADLFAELHGLFCDSTPFRPLLYRNMQ